MNRKSDISAIILEIEKEENLFDWKIHETYIWELIRVKLFLYLQEASSSETYGKSGSKGFFCKMKTLFSRLFRNVIFRNPFFFHSNPDILIFESGKKYKFEGEYIDIYTHFIEEKYKKEKTQIEVYETNFQYDFIGRKRKQHLDFILIFSKVFSLFLSDNLDKEDIEGILRIENIIKERTQVDLNLREIIKEEIKLFKAQNIFYSKLLDRKSPKVIYLVNYIYFFALLNQAKKRNIKTIELQHGLIIKEALIYHFPYTIEGSLNYFPEEFFIWKGFVTNSGKLPLAKHKIKENDYNHIEIIKKKYKDIEKNELAILIASQPFFSDRIVRYILRNAPEMPDYTFYYKLHPMQFNSFFQHKKATELLEMPNIRIIKNEISIYELLSICKYTIGIYSTSLFEAPVFNSIPLILLHEETDYATSLLESNTALALSEEQPLMSYIKKKL